MKAKKLQGIYNTHLSLFSIGCFILDAIYFRFRKKMQEQAEEEERLKRQEAIDGKPKY